MRKGQEVARVGFRGFGHTNLSEQTFTNMYILALLLVRRFWWAAAMVTGDGKQGAGHGAEKYHERNQIVGLIHRNSRLKRSLHMVFHNHAPIIPIVENSKNAR